MTPAKRRQHGTGTIYQRDDGRWIGRLEAGYTSTGTRRRVNVSGRTEAEVKTKLKTKARELASTGPGTAGTARVTVKSWADTWLPLHAQQVRPSTYATDSGAIRKWVIPTIGHRRLTDLTPADVRAVRTAITAAGRSTTTALHAHTQLVSMLKAAIVEGHQVPPRVLLVPKPGRAANDRQDIPLDDAIRMLAVIQTRPDAPRWVAGLLQGMRQGEVLGLTWSRVDLDAGLIDVSWQRQDLPYLDKTDRARGFLVPDDHESIHLTGATHLTRPKTSKGKRVIPIVPWMRAALLEARARWQPNEWDLIWTMTDTRNGRDRVVPMRPERDRAVWDEVQQTAGVRHPSGRPYLVHETRHTTATLLMEAGVDRAVIEAILGQAVLVKDYLHVNSTATRSALEQVAARLTLGGPET